MKRFVCLAIAAAMLFAVPLAAGAVEHDPTVEGGVASISDNYTAQMVEDELDVRVKIHPTIWMDTDVDSFLFECLNPYNNTTALFAFEWSIKSNVPFYYRIEVKDLAKDDTAIESMYPGEDGYPEGYPDDIQYVDVILEDDELAAPDNIFVDGNQVSNPFWTEDAVGDKDNHEFEFDVDFQIGPIDWCDTAGYYDGKVLLCAYQN